jgi:hypothetical protein
MIKIKKQKNLRTAVAALFGKVAQVMPRINDTCYVCILEPKSLQACCRERSNNCQQYMDLKTATHNIIY